MDDVDILKEFNPNEYSFESELVFNVATIKMIKYFDNETLVKVTLYFDCERQDLNSEYYYDENGLLFIFRTLITYEEPKWSDTFDQNNNDQKENRYYFEQGELIKWIDSNQISHFERTIDFVNQEKKSII